MKLYDLQKDLATFFGNMFLLGTAPLNVKVYQEEHVPANANHRVGFVTWECVPDDLFKCSTGLQGTSTHMLEVTVWATRMSDRVRIMNFVYDQLYPEVSGEREFLKEQQWSTFYLHSLVLEDMQDVTVEKTGHNTPETTGITLFLKMKVST